MDPRGKLHSGSCKYCCHFWNHTIRLRNEVIRKRGEEDVWLVEWESSLRLERTQCQWEKACGDPRGRNQSMGLSGKAGGLGRPGQAGLC